MSLTKEASPAALALMGNRPLSVPAASCVEATAQRWLSIDALRGFAMLWLIGGREFVLALVGCLYPPWYDAWETQLMHTKWQGFVAWDLVMPVFLFVVGVSMPLAMSKHCDNGEPPRSAYGRIARRVAVLWLLGILVQVFRPDSQGLELYSNALQAIAVGYLVAALALLHLRLGGQIGLLVSLVVGYGALLMFVPFPGHPAGTLEPTVNLPRYVDELLLGGFRRDHAYTWAVTSLGFSATVLLGAMAGHLFRAPLPAARRIASFVAIGAGCMAAGWLWSHSLPLNRHLWTSSMVLWAGGIGFLLLAAFYAVIDVAGVRRWTFPLAVIGANALLAYVIDPVFIWIGKNSTAYVVADVATPYGELCFSFCEMTCLWLLLWCLYQRRAFFRA